MLDVACVWESERETLTVFLCPVPVVLTLRPALDFLNIYQRMIPPIQKKTSMLAHYLLELALQEYQFLKYLPSVVATCCLSMAMFTVDGFPMVRFLFDCAVSSLVGRWLVD